MRLKPFNPDKELKKSNRKYTKKQLITTLLVLVVMITIGSSYAIFSIQPEYHTFIKSQVGEFSTGDIKLSVLVEGIAQSDFPAKDTGYAFESVTCDNGSTGTWDADAWQLTLTTQGPDKCTVSFKNIFFTFKVGEFSFKAEEGMTWNDWLNSDYYDKSIYSFHKLCYFENGNIVLSYNNELYDVKYNGNNVLPNEVIQRNSNYILKGYGGDSPVCP